MRPCGAGQSPRWVLRSERFAFLTARFSLRLLPLRFSLPDLRDFSFMRRGYTPRIPDVRPFGAQRPADRGVATYAHAVPISPDTKDWTWVLERACPECGFDARGFPREEVGRMVRDNAETWKRVLGETALVARRPDDDTWSALEYACHVRDVFSLYDHRLDLMLTQDEPTYPNWDQDEAAVAASYRDQDPARVATELGRAADDLANRFDTVAGSAWDRTGTRSDGAHFTVESFARYLVHDPVHHLYDVERGFEALRAASS